MQGNESSADAPMDVLKQNAFRVLVYFLPGMFRRVKIDATCRGKCDVNARMQLPKKPVSILACLLLFILRSEWSFCVTSLYLCLFCMTLNFFREIESCGSTGVMKVLKTLTQILVFLLQRERRS